MIYFVRHGETEYNKQGRSQGQADIPLNRVGVSQANQTSESLKSINIDIIYCSPLTRAKHTAEIINKYHNAKIVFDERINHYDVGERQGKLFASWPEEIKQEYINNPEKHGAESYQHFYDRVVEFYKTIENDTRDILIVSHGGVYMNIYRYINGYTDLSKKIEHKPLENTQFAVLKTKEKV